MNQKFFLFIKSLSEDQISFSEDDLLHFAQIDYPSWGYFKKKDISFDEYILRLNVFFSKYIEDFNKQTKYNIREINYWLAEKYLKYYHLYSPIYINNLNISNLKKSFLRKIDLFKELEWLNNQLDHFKKKTDYYKTKQSNILRIEQTIELIINSMISAQQDKIANTDRSLYEYRILCSFDISNENIHLIKGYDLLCKLGWYHPKNNIHGVVKDHRYSILEGYRNKIPPNIIGHIANCEFLPLKVNSSKNSQCSISLIELEKLIKKNKSIDTIEILVYKYSIPICLCILKD